MIRKAFCEIPIPETWVRDYQRRTSEQELLVSRASQIREKLLLLKSSMNALFADKHFLTLLRAEDLQQVPDGLTSDGIELR